MREEFVDIVNSIKNGTFDTSVFKLPSVIYMIQQPGKSGKIKNRLIYCPPFAVTVLEMVLGLDIIDYFKGESEKGKGSVVLGNKQLDLYELNIKLKNYHKTSGDYSSYDQTIPSFYMLTAFEIIRLMSSIDDNEYLSNLFDELTGYIIRGHIYHPNTGVIKRKRGIASGSVFTGIIDSLCNVLILCATMQHNDLALLTNIFVGGDDSLLPSTKKLNTDYITKMCAKIGMKNVYDSESYYPSGDMRCAFLGSV